MRPTDQLKEWEWIEAYHKGTLSAEERLIYEQELARDPDFMNTSEQLRIAEQVLQTWGLEQTVRQAVRQELRNKKIVRTRRWRIARVAGIVLVSSGLLYGTYFSFSPVDMDSYHNDIVLVQRYRSPDEETFLTEMTPQQRAFYRNFFDAQAYLANGQPELAIPKLEKLERVEGLRSYFRQAVQWHLVNAYLLCNQPNNAEATYKLLEQVSEPVYPISPADRWKVWCQIRWYKLTH